MTLPLVRKADGRYYVRVWHEGRQVWRSLRTRRRPPGRVVAEAEARLWEELGRTDRLTGGLAGGAQPTAVGILIEDFLSGIRARRSEGHVKRLECALRQAGAVLGTESLSTWTAPAIQRYLDDGIQGKGWRKRRGEEDRRRPWKPRTAVLHRQSLGRFLGWCVRRGEIRANPVEFVEKPRVERAGPRPPRSGEVERLLAVAAKYDGRQGPRGAWLEFACRMVLGTGVRKSELAGLLWTDVDLERNILTVRAEISKAHRDREVPLKRIAREALTGTPEKERRGRILPREAPLRADNGTLQEVTEAAGLGRIGFQRLRQWYGSRLVMARVPVPTVQEVMGHRSVLTTMTHYTAVTPEHVADEIARSDREESLGGATVATDCSQDAELARNSLQRRS